MGRIWDIASSSLMLAFFLVAVYGGVVLARRMSAGEKSATSSLKKRGVTYEDGKLSVKTDRRAMTLEEEVEKSKAKLSSGVRSAYNNSGFGASVDSKASASGYESPSRGGFQRTKKLD